MAHQQTLPVDTELIGDFRILSLLGSGGFANTYLALDLTLGREVAIKEFFPSELAVRADTQSVSVKSTEQESQFEWALGRFVREAKTLAKFRHPSVVRVFRVFDANDTAYMVLEFVRGADMESWLKRLGRPPTQEELDEVLPPLLDALEVVHKAGILHRDIKPANIYIREADQTPVLLDFGAAKYAAAAAGDAANTTAAIVSKGYSPNEAYTTDSQMQGPWTDLYSLAATVYRALTGSAPQESTSRILDDNCVPLTSIPELQVQYRPEFLSAIDQALAVIPKDRPQSIAQWRKTLFPGLSVASASGDPASPQATSDQEWRPLSDTPSDAAPAYNSSGSIARSAGSIGRTDRVSGQRASQASRATSGSRPASIANRALFVGLALMVAGVVGVASQWLADDQASRGGSSTAVQEAQQARLAKRQAEDEKKRKAEVERLRREKEEAEAEAERLRLEAERRDAEEKQLIEVKAAAEQKRKDDESKRVAAEAADRARAQATQAREEEARLLAELEEIRRRRDEERSAARAEEERSSPLEQNPRSNSDVAGTSESAGNVEVTALDPRKVVPDEDGRRDYLIKVQTVLKDGRCYDGKLTGQMDDASGALKKFETTYTSRIGKPQEINLTSATTGEFEDWLNWFDRLGGFTCKTQPAVVKKKSKPKYKKRSTKRSKRATRKKKTTQRKTKRKKSAQRKPKAPAKSNGLDAGTATYRRSQGQ